MAEPIPLQMPPGDARRELLLRLQNAPAEHAEALLAAYEVLQGLHDRGVLDLMRGALGSGDKIVEEAVLLSNTPESIRAIRNGVILLKTVGALDPELLNAFFGAMPGALAEAKTPEPPGLLKMLYKFRSKDFRRGLATVNSFLEGFGRNISSERHSTEQKHENK